MARGEPVPTDLLQLMLTSRDRVTGKTLSDENIRFQLITFLIAGHDTTSGLLSYALYYLATHPNVEAQLTDEVDRVLGRDFSHRPSFQDIEKLEYTTRVLREALRLHPPAPGFSKTPSKDVVLGGKYVVKAGSEVSVFLPGLHRNVRYWGQDAAVFDPDRFLPEAVRARHSNAYHPFGLGMRGCIGSQFALIEARLVLARLYQRFKPRLSTPGYTLTDAEGLTLKPKDLYLVLDRRPEGPGLRPAAEKAAPVVQREAAAEGRPMLVLYGSNMGSSRDRAEDIARQAAANGFAATVEELDDRVGRLPVDTPVVIVTSTYNGQPPDNAKKFADWLEGGAGPGALRGVRYGVLGLGNRQWRTTFQKFPELVAARLAALGGEAFHPAGAADADGDAEAAAEAWTSGLWRAVKQAFPGVDPSARDARPEQSLIYAVKQVASSPEKRAPAGAAMEVLTNDELQAEGSGRSTRHLELALPTGVAYVAGDHLGVFAKNPSDLVATLARRCGVLASDVVEVSPRMSLGGEALPTGVPIRVEELLGEHVDLVGPLSRRELRMLAERCPCPPERRQLEALLEPDRFRAEVVGAGLTLMDLLSRYGSIECTLELLLSMRPAMKPRYYSISSSPKVSPRACSITVGVLSVDLPGGRTQRGLCSQYLSGAQVGARLRAFVKDTHSAFRLPADPSRAVILVGAGTGVAPLRGFIQERAARATAGDRVGETVLFFGCRHPALDFVYRREFEEAVQAGTLAGLFPAFSRVPEQPRAYVQDRIRDEATLVQRLVDAGAHIYVCGDARRMAPDVQRAFLEVFERAGRMSAAQAEARLVALKADARYVEDVWAAT